MSPLAESADLARPERLHPLILITGLGGSLRGVAGGYAGIGYLAATGRLETALIAGGALLLFLALSLFLYWRRFEYRVGAHEIRIDSGIISRTHRSIPFDRVQDVDISQGPIARLLGLAKVKFETGGSAGSDEAVLPAIALARAQSLREHIRARRGGPTPSVVSDDEPRPLFAMSLKRVLTAGMFNFSLAIFAGLFGATQTFGDLLGFDPFEREFWEVTLSDNAFASYAANHKNAAFVAGLFLLIAAGLLTGIIRTLLRDFRFRLDRTGTGLRRRRGLFTLTDVTLPLRRVQAALILTGPVRERFGWRELKFQSLARDEEAKSGDHVIAPLAQTDELRPILAELGWEDALAAQPWEHISLAYVSSLAVWLLGPLVLALIGLAFSPMALIGIGALALVLGTRWLAWRRTRFALAGERLLIRTGWWKRSTLILPLRSIQSIDLTQNAVARRFGIAALTFGVAGGSGFTGHSIPGLPRKRASQIREALLSRFA
ncbi:PH domain-containing protein [Sphingomonas arenae]|uniref:PH domain-containing protein n=1 Tax=Sphingomonas arenae TaxID=2812555 RepID=UPI0019684247|nr:PH domain-containing protein [Sphingomonas arenae]